MKKVILSVLICLMLAGTVQPPKAHGVFLLAALLVVSGGLLIWDHNSCWLNWFWGCDGDSGGGAPSPGDGCVSPMNACGGRNGGLIQADGTCDAVTPPDSLCTPCESDPNSCGLKGSGYLVNGDTCDAVVPSESLCPPTAVVEFAAVPDRFIDALGERVNLEWTIDYATDCSLSVNGATQSVSTTTEPSALSPSGYFQTEPLFRPATDITLSCYNDVPENSARWTIRVMAIPGAVEF